jgi:hypothetical protein
MRAILDILKPNLQMIKRVQTVFKALRELGLQPLLSIMFYRMGLRTGFWRWRTPPQKEYQDYRSDLIISDPSDGFCRFPLSTPEPELLSSILSKDSLKLISEADEICAGKIRLFGGRLVPLDFNIPKNREQKQHHWTDYERGLIPWGVEDVKYIWEPGRFGWAYTLGRAYLLTGNETYPEAFWQRSQEFLKAHPPNMGPHWTSAQEVSLRLLSLLFADRIFSKSVGWTLERRSKITNAVIAHAARIPPTIVYARAQNNNHLLVEALGLYAAGVSLQGWPAAPNWKTQGWNLIQHALRTQISSRGEYVQQSTNYHRLMLQAALWAQTIARSQDETLPQDCLQLLELATRWLLAQMDPISGHLPNLGHNDGAYILPFSTTEYGDFRPVAQAAARAFLGKDILPAGNWNEFCLWLGLPSKMDTPVDEHLSTSSAVHRLGNVESWGTLRAAYFTQRPAHADQLHVDLWWRGKNVAIDAGTYLYNAQPPWENSLSHTEVHNTLTVAGKDQMKRSGRFLWLDWAQAKIISGDSSNDRLTAEHNGYRKMGITHRRSLIRMSDHHWLVRDDLLSTRAQTQPTNICINWLLQDWDWEINANTLRQTSPQGIIELYISQSPLSSSNHSGTPQYNPPILLDKQIVRCGKILHGKVDPIPAFLGWHSPTYGRKLPAIAFRVSFQGNMPFSIFSEWTFSR